MKKIIAMLLSLIMVCGLATVAFAETPTLNNKDQDLTEYLNKPGVISKKYVVNSGVAPAETFTFKFTGVSYENGDGKVVADATIPAIENQTIEFKNAIDTETSETVEFEIDPSEYELGVYTYEVQEVKPDAPTTGVTYSTEKLYLVLTILRAEDSSKHYVAAIHYQAEDGAKTNVLTNEYDSGSLAITKQITGNMADMSKEFSFTVKFNVPSDAPTAGHVITTNIAGTAGTLTLSDGLEHTFDLGDGDTATFTNLPAGTTYTIYEDKENYTQLNVTGETFADDQTNGKTVTGEIEAGDEDEAEFTNELKSTVDTGVALDSAPYIVMLVVAMAGVVALVAKKRYEV